MSEMLMLMKSELLVAALIFIILFMKITGAESDDPAVSNRKLLWVVNVLLTGIVISGFFGSAEGLLFGGMFVNTTLLILEKNILLLGTLVVSLLAWPWLRNHKHAHEFYMLMLSTLLGMFFMLSSDNLMMFYLGLELSTIPLAAMVNFDLDRKRSSEAAMKMIMMSAFSSGLLLFGISMLYGTTGTLSLTLLPMLLDGSPLQLFALVLVIAGFGFKISAVPFHLWTADVYEGAPAPVTAYLSVVSKGAVLFAMLPVLYRSFAPMGGAWYQVLAILAVLTMIVGNLFALRQDNLKRLLAFSSIAQVGFILVGMTGQSPEGASAVIYFLIIYLFSNLGAFTVITLVGSATGKETIHDYRGFYKTNPLLAWILAISLFSLAGIPPVAGFFGKFFLLLAGAGNQNYPLVIVASLNMIVSLYYYLRVIKAMFMDTNEQPIPAIQSGRLPQLAISICLFGMLVTGLYSGAYEYIYSLFTLR